MEIAAHAKINLTLDITGRDERGYHLLSSVFSEISLADTVTLTPEGRGITMTCDFPFLPTDSRNLCVKAAIVFLESFALKQRNFHIDLVKRIPSQAGLGGGSSDGAAVLKLLCRHFNLPVTHPKVQAVALSVGADVPFFLTGGCCLAQGVGEKLTPLPSPTGYTLVLAKTLESASTPEVYRLYDSLPSPQPPTTSAFLSALKQGGDFTPHISNHLTAATQSVCPSVLRLKQELLAAGAVASEMTGSGSCVYGLFPSEERAVFTAQTLKADFVELCRFV